MSDYIVSARKYRPMTFDTVVGQGSIATTLKNAILTGKLAHAYLFCGPRGVGKTTCARIFAKTINCLNPREDGEACNECESCQAFNEQRSMNIHELDAASNNSVDDIRALIDQVRIPPQIGKYKVFIIDEVHMLSASAFNAFLKTLEEPPAFAIFIPATTEKHKILPTILSRCQIYDFQRMSVEDTVNHLTHVAQQEGYTFEPAPLTIIAQKADGGMRDALSIFDQVASYSGGDLTYQRVIENLNVLDYDYYFRLLVSKDPQTASLLEVSDDIRQHYQQQAQRCKVQWLFRAIRLCNDCDQAYRTSRNKRLQVELALIECAQATDDDPGAGRRPANILKPIFSLLAAVASETAPVVSSTQQLSTSVVTSSPSATAPTSPISSQPSSSPHSWSFSTTQSAPAKLKTLKLGAIAPSIRTHQEHKTPQTATIQPALEEPKEDSEEALTLENKPIEANDLYLQWQQFINSMPQAETALAQRMRIMRPELTDPELGTILLILDNNEVVKMMQQVQTRLVAFLRQQLHNQLLTITFKVSEQPKQQVRVYDKNAQFRHLTELNPALANLKKAFQLELE